MMWYQVEVVWSMMMSMTCYYDTNDELFINMINDAKLLYEHDELLYISVGEMNMD